MLQFVVTELEQIGAKYLAAKKGYKSTADIFTHSHTFSSPYLGLQKPARRSSLSVASNRILPLMPMEQDSGAPGVY